MKLLNQSTLILLLVLFCGAASAQKTDSRQKFFAAYPESIILNKSVIINAMQYSEGANVSVPLSAGFNFSGTVISNKKKYGNMQTVIIRTANNSLLQITEVRNTDNTFSYAGRILNQNSADGFEIINTNGFYTLQKFETNKILQPCNF